MREEIVVLMKFGSHLYGTNTSDSDTDYKGIFFPSKEQIYLGKIPKSISKNTKHGDGKNTPSDVDTEIYSFHYFIHLACEGETVALDMLHAPDNMILESSPFWDELKLSKSLFYTKSLKAFVGYAKRQAAKYGIKGSRLNAAKQVIAILEQNDPNARLSTIWDSLPEGEHLVKHPENENGIKEYEICGRKAQESGKIYYVLDMVKKFYDAYGVRAILAAKNQGIDWKAVSHAIRAAFQVKEVLLYRDITFPLKQADYIKAVKQGKLDYTTEVAPYLESLISEVEILSSKSTLPEKANRKYWDSFIIKKIDEYIH